MSRIVAAGAFGRWLTASPGKQILTYSDKVVILSNELPEDKKIVSGNRKNQMKGGERCGGSKETHSEKDSRGER